MELLGHYVGFVGVDGCAVPWLQRVQNFLPNGMHAVIVGDEFVRVEMFRFENTYDLLITTHWLERKDGRRAELRSAILFLGRNGFLGTELWGKDAAFRWRRHASLSDSKRRTGAAGSALDRRDTQGDRGGLLLRMPSFAPAGSRTGGGAETGRGTRMIDWHHPRIYERLRCFGLTLFTLGVASHNEAIRPSRLRPSSWRRSWSSVSDSSSELAGMKSGTSLERKLRRIDLINALAIVPAALGALALLLRLSHLGMSFNLTGRGAREPQ